MTRLFWWYRGTLENVFLLLVPFRVFLGPWMIEGAIFHHCSFCGQSMSKFLRVYHLVYPFGCYRVLRYEISTYSVWTNRELKYKPFPTTVAYTYRALQTDVGESGAVTCYIWRIVARPLLWIVQKRASL
jgi:hypothetical protein